MNPRRSWLVNGLSAVLLCAGLPSVHGQATTPAAPSRLSNWLASPKLMGQQRFTYWGFAVYDASLWANTSFASLDWAQYTLVLELRYLRDFKGADIAQRSIDEMDGQRALSAMQAQSWSAQLRQLIPNVREGERLTGVYTPNKSLQLFHQDQLVGEVRDGELAQRFMGIWLAPETSQRQLRQQLLAGAQP
jgi:hypothetical protein